MEVQSPDLQLKKECILWSCNLDTRGNVISKGGWQGSGQTRLGVTILTGGQTPEKSQKKTQGQ